QEVSLVGTLFTPIHDDRKTTLVFIHGSGVSDRGNFWYMYQADYFAKKGYTVLLPDKRGCGKSHGEWHTASFDDFAMDITVGIEYLIERQEMRDHKVGVLGLSQGGWISHIVAEKSHDVDFVIDVVSSATTPAEQLYFEIKRDMEDGGAPSFISGLLSTVFSRRSMGKRKVWWDHNKDYDPISMLSKTRVPVLKIFGSEDKNVPVEKSLSNLELMMIDQPDLPITIKVFEDSGHALFNDNNRWIRTDYLDLVNGWIGRSDINSN
ncbi:MAG: alpha/beta hydrolase, partial [Flavobacteriaceae bacterium]